MKELWKHLVLCYAFCSLLLLFFSACSYSQQAVRQKPDQQDLPEGPVEAVASWYGSDFHGRPTASGQIFDMHLHTCAHKQFPFGTKLRVTHKTNNKSIECVVNDRGPFVVGRDIDLSYASAKAIDLIGPGIAPVLIEIQGRDLSYIKPVRVQSPARKGSPFAIQVGSFTDSINAVRLKVSLRLKYANAHIQETEVKGATWYRVRIGNFDQFSQAMETAEQLGQEGYPVLVVKADLKM